MDSDFYTIDDLEDELFAKQFSSKKAALDEAAKLHISHLMNYKHNGIDLTQKCFLPVWSDEFELPSSELVGQVVEILRSRGMTKNQISECLGISTKGSNRLLNYWINPESDRTINKSNWIVLATMAGLIMPVMFMKKKPHSV